MEHRDASNSQELQNVANFSTCYFNDLYKLCGRVYAEKPEVKNFNEYVKALILKDLEQN